MTTPMMRQYHTIKEKHSDAILFFRMGDFYEMFFDDAEVASKVLEITLTSRSKERGEKIPMCGVPYHAAKNYIARLVQSGRKVAICEQVEDPALAQGIVRREVTHVVTPGVNLDTDQLAAKENHFLAALVISDAGCAIALLDASTGDFRGTSLIDGDSALGELQRLAPKELLLAEDAPVEQISARFEQVFVNPLPVCYFDVSDVRRNVSPSAVTALIAPDYEPALQQAMAATLAYLSETQPAALSSVTHFARYDADAYMNLGPSTWDNLEIDRTLIGGHRKGSLLQLLDETQTAMGGRLLRRWLAHPLMQQEAIHERLHFVDLFRRKASARADLRRHLGNVYDLERLAGRIASALANPKEVAALKRSILELPDLLAHLRELDDVRCANWVRDLDTLEDVAQTIGETLVDDPPALLKDGGVIRDGFNAELDELIGLSRDGKSWMLNYEERERAETGISSLKVKYNKIFGYYLEVTKANFDAVPAHYIRKQTLVNAERYITPTLKEFEEKVLSAEERRVSMETALFETLRGELAEQAQRIKATAREVARLDVLTSFAHLAHRMNYCRPEIDDTTRLQIRGGRHPVLEAMLTGERFVPNDTTLDSENHQLLIITGPNMAGKSTVMRQVALIVLMAQVGSFVPADSAQIGLVDQIFTRVGASDNLSRGQSTFMVEMMETATILERATSRSLIVLDEIGRGTSTFDGLSIAWAVAEDLHDRVGARTMFATHYHEMVDLAQTRARTRNYSVAVKEWNDEIIFLRELVEGGTSRSYGIQVAKLAGLPLGVITRAKEILRNLETDEVDEVGSPRLARQRGTGDTPRQSARQMMLFAGPAAAPVETDRLREMLAQVRLERTTPLDALQLLYKLKDLL